MCKEFKAEDIKFPLQNERVFFIGPTLWTKLNDIKESKIKLVRVDSSYFDSIEPPNWDIVNKITENDD